MHACNNVEKAILQKRQTGTVLRHAVNVCRAYVTQADWDLFKICNVKNYRIGKGTDTNYMQCNDVIERIAAALARNGGRFSRPF